MPKSQAYFPPSPQCSPSELPDRTFQVPSKGIESFSRPGAADTNAMASARMPASRASFVFFIENRIRILKSQSQGSFKWIAVARSIARTAYWGFFAPSHAFASRR